MSTVNYSLKNKGVRLISAEQAWIQTRNGKRKLNPKYKLIGKIQISMPNMVVSADDLKKPKYRGCTCDLNSTAKKQIIDHFYDEKGKRNKKSVAYFGVEKQKRKKVAKRKKN